MTLAAMMDVGTKQRVAELRDRLHYDLMMGKPIATLDRARGHLACSGRIKGSRDLNPATVDAIRLLDRAYWQMVTPAKLKQAKVDHRNKRRGRQ